MTEDLRERLKKARAQLAGYEKCQATILSRYDNRIVKCELTGPHPDRAHEGPDYGELRRW